MNGIQLTAAYQVEAKKKQIPKKVKKLFGLEEKEK